MSNRLHYRIFLPLTVRRAAAVIAPSETTRRDIVRHLGVGEDRVHVVPLGISAVFRAGPDTATADRLRREHGLPEKFIFFAGRNDVRKNLRGLVDAFHALRTAGTIGHRLVVAGRPDTAQATVQRRIRTLGLADEVRFLHYVPDAELAALYSMADVFVFPSLYEGFGLPPLEAMACGTPVVASNRGAVQEMTRGGALQVDPEDVAALARAIREVIVSPDVRQRLIAGGRAVVRDLSWERAARATEHVYRQARRARTGQGER